MRLRPKRAIIGLYLSIGKLLVKKLKILLTFKMIKKHGCGYVYDKVEKCTKANYDQNHYFWIESVWY